MRGLGTTLLALLVLPVLATASHDAFVPVMEKTALQTWAEIRPGAWMSGPHNCTMAFVVRDAAAKLYITTAGHCNERVGQEVSIRGMGRIGFVKARVWSGADDRALVEIDPGLYSRVNSTMKGWGGPVGVATSMPEPGSTVKYYGWGYLSYPVHASRCRVGAFDPTYWTSLEYSAFGHISNGDSGGPILTEDGLALGLTNYGLPGWFGGIRFDTLLARFEAKTGLDLELVPGEPVRGTCDVG